MALSLIDRRTNSACTLRAAFATWKYLVSALILTAGLSACTKKEGEYISVNPFIKDLVNWQPGSYWIMKDSATGHMDSFFVSRYTLYVTNKSYGIQHEHISVSIKNFSAANLADSIRLFVSSGENGNSPDMGLYKGNSDTAVYCVLFPCPVYGNDISVSINGATYEHAYYNSSLIYGSANGNYLSFIINKSTGLIKLAVQDGGFRHKWLLERYLLVRS